MKSATYNLHGRVKVSFTPDFPLKFVPEDFRDEKVRGANLIISERKDLRFNKGKYQRIDEFYGGGGKLYFELPKFGLFTYKMLISDFPKKTVFSFTQSMRLHKMEDFVALVELLLEIKLLQRGCTLVHGAGVSKGPRGHLISGWGGAGKTSTMMALSRKGFKMLGDEVVILSKNGTLYSFPIMVDIRPTTEHAPELPIGKRIQGSIKNLINKISPFDLPMSPGVGVKLSQIGEVEKMCKLDKVFFVEQSPTRKLEKLPKAAAVKKLMSMNKLELFGLEFPSKVFAAYCYLNDFDPLFIEKETEKIFKRAVSGCYLVKGDKKQHYKLIMKEIV